MTIITLWAIRHNPSDGYLFMPTAFTGRGGSYSEPINYPDKSGRQPRLFNSERAAKGALAAWLKGKWESHRMYDEDEEYLVIKPQPNRKRKEMEIVPITIELPSFQEI